MMELLDVDENGFFAREDGENVKVLKITEVINSKRVRVLCDKKWFGYNVTEVIDIRSKGRAGR